MNAVVEMAYSVAHPAEGEHKFGVIACRVRSRAVGSIYMLL